MTTPKSLQMQTRMQTANAAEPLSPISSSGGLLMFKVNSRRGLGACHKTTQEQFLKQMGIISTVDIELEEVLMPEQAHLLVVALSHKSMGDSLCDPNFTEEEWAKTCCLQQGLIKLGEQLFVKSLSGELTHEESKQWLQKKKENDEASVCNCEAHLLYNEYREFFDISPPLNDDSGKRLALNLIPRIISSANIIVTDLSSGSGMEISFILKLPSGMEIMYSSTATAPYVGYGDFVGFETYTAAQRRLQSEPLARQARLRMSGDVQSPPGSSAAAKQLAIAQGSIYACGQFKTKVTTEKKIVSVNLFKDMTARIALATMSPTDPGDRSLGILKYEFLDSSIGYNIRLEDDLCQFASVLVGALKDSMTSVY